jgi:hypothetical protein
VAASTAPAPTAKVPQPNVRLWIIVVSATVIVPCVGSAFGLAMSALPMLTDAPPASPPPSARRSAPVRPPAPPVEPPAPPPQVPAEPAVSPPTREALAAARVRLGTVEVRGPLTPQLVRRVVRRHESELRFCYARGLSTDPDLEGRATLTCTVARTGAVPACSIESSTLNNPAIEDCMTQAGMRWTFPGLEADATFAYPLTLTFE